MASVYNYITRKILVTIATRLASKYVEGIDLESFNSSLFRGEVSLRDIKLKQLALDKINLPIVVQEVAISKIDIKIPISNILTTAWSIKIDGLMIRVKPRETGKAFPETAERAREMREKSIDSCSDAFKLKQKLNETFSGRLGIRDKIMRNVFIDVQNLTFRFSHHVTETAPPVVVSLASFHLSTVDELSADTPVHSSNLFFRKRCVVKSIAVDIVGDSHDQHALSLSHIDAILNIKINPFELDLDIQLGHIKSKVSSKYFIPPKCTAESRQCGICKVCCTDVCLVTAIKRSILRLRSTTYCVRPSKVQLIEAKKLYFRSLWRYCAISARLDRRVRYLKPTRGSLNTEKRRWYLSMWLYAVRCTIGAAQRTGSRFSNWGQESYKLLEAKQKVLNEYYQLKLKQYKGWRLSKVETRLLAEYEYHLPIPTMYETWDSVIAEGNSSRMSSIFSIPILPTLKTTKKSGRIVGRIFSVHVKCNNIHIDVDGLMMMKVATCTVSGHYCSGTPYVKSGITDVVIPDVDGNNVRITAEKNCIKCWVNGKLESPSTSAMSIDDDGKVLIGPKPRTLSLPWDTRPTLLGKLKHICNGKDIKHNLPESSGGIRLHLSGFEFSVPRRKAAGYTKVVHIKKSCLIKYNRETRQKMLTVQDMAPRTVQQVALEVNSVRCIIDNDDIVWFMKQILPVTPPKEILKPWKTKCIAGAVCEPFTAAYLPLDTTDMIISGIPPEIICSTSLEGIYTSTTILVNGHKTWLHQSRQTILCTTTTGHWAITDFEGSGLVHIVSSSFHGGVHPIRYRGDWLFHSISENDWISCPSIKFSKVKSYWNPNQTMETHDMSICDPNDIAIDDYSIIGLQTACNDDVISTSSDRIPTYQSDVSQHFEAKDLLNGSFCTPLVDYKEGSFNDVSTLSRVGCQMLCESQSPPVDVCLNILSYKSSAVPDILEFQTRTGDNVVIKYCQKLSRFEATINGTSIIRPQAGVRTPPDVTTARVDVSGNPKVELLGIVPSRIKVGATRQVTIPMGRIAMPLEDLPHTLTILKNICELSNIKHNIPDQIQVAGMHTLSDPHGLCCSENGNIYIADTTNHRIMKWIPGTSSGSLVSGGLGVGDSKDQLSSPLGVYVFGNDIFVADTDNHRIQRIHSIKNYNHDGTTDGTYTLTTATAAGGNGKGSSASELSHPRQVVIGPDNCMYICDTGNNRVQRWELGNSEATTVAGDPSGEPGSSLSHLNNPSGIFISRDICDSCMFVADTNNHRIIRFLLGGLKGAVVAGQTGVIGYRSHLLNFPRGVAVQADGTIFVADSSNNRIQCFPSNLQEGKGQTIWSGDSPPRAISLGRDNKVVFSAGSTVFEATSHTEVACITQFSWVELSPYFPSEFTFGGEKRYTIYDCYSQCSSRDDWSGRTVDETLLYDIILTSLSAQETRRRILLTTDKQLLRYVNYEDGIWGTGFDGRGRNIYGKVLTKVRSHVCTPPASIGVLINDLHAEIPLRRTSTESQKWTAIFEASEVCVPGAGIDVAETPLFQNKEILEHVLPIEIMVSNADFCFQRQTTFGYPLEVSELVHSRQPSSFSILQSISDIALGRVAPLLSKANIYLKLLMTRNHQLPTVPWLSFHCGLYSRSEDGTAPPIVNLCPKSGVLLGYFQKELIEIVSNPMLLGKNEDRRCPNARILEFCGWETSLPKVVQHGEAPNDRITWYPSRVVVSSEEYSMSERWVMKMFREATSSSVWPCCNPNADYAFDPSAIVVLRQGLSVSPEPYQMDLPVLDDIPFLADIIYQLQTYSSPMPFDNFPDTPARLLAESDVPELKESLIAHNVSQSNIESILSILTAPVIPTAAENAHRLLLELHRHLTQLHESYYAITWTLRGGSTGLSTVLKVGDEVLVRNSDQEEWTRGHISRLSPDGRHHVTTLNEQPIPSPARSEATLVRKKWAITERYHKLRLGEIVIVRNHLDEPWQRATVVGIPEEEGSNDYRTTLLPPSDGTSNTPSPQTRKKMFKFAKLRIDEHFRLQSVPIEIWCKNQTSQGTGNTFGMFKYAKRQTDLAINTKVLVRDSSSEKWLEGVIKNNVRGYQVDVGGVQKVWRQIDSLPPTFKSGDRVLVRNATDKPWIRALYVSGSPGSYKVQQQGASTQTTFSQIHVDESLTVGDAVKVRNHPNHEWQLGEFQGINPTTGLFKANISNKSAHDGQAPVAVRCRNAYDMPWEYGILLSKKDDDRKGFRVMTEHNRSGHYQHIQRITLKEGDRVKVRNNATEQWIYGRLGSIAGTLSRQGQVAHKMNNGDRIMIRIRANGAKSRKWAEARMTTKDNVAEIRARGQDTQYFHITQGDYVRISTADTELGGSFEVWVIGIADKTPNTILLDSTGALDVPDDDASTSDGTHTRSPKKTTVYQQVIPDTSVQVGDPVFVRRSHEEQWIPATLSSITPHSQDEGTMYVADLYHSVDSTAETESVFNYIEKDVSFKPGDAVKVRDAPENPWKYGVVVSSFGGYHVQLTARKYREAQQVNSTSSIELSKAKVWRETERDNQCLRIGDTVRVKDCPSQKWTTGVLTFVRDGGYETESLLQNTESIATTVTQTYEHIERLDSTVSCTLKHKSLIEAKKLLNTLKSKISETLDQTNNYGGTSSLHPTTQPAAQYLPNKHGLLDDDSYPEGTFHKTHFYVEVPSIEVRVSNCLLHNAAIIQCKNWWWESSQTFYDFLGDTAVESCKVWVRNGEVDTCDLIKLYNKKQSELNDMASLLSGSDCQIQTDAQDKPWMFSHLWNKLGDSVARASYRRQSLFAQPTGFAIFCEIVGSRKSPNRRTPPQYPPLIGWDTFLSTRSKTNASDLVNEPLAMHFLFIISWQDQSLFCRSVGKRGMYMSCELGDVQANIENLDSVGVLLQTATHYYDPRYGIPELLNSLRQPYYEPIPVGEAQVDISDVKIFNFSVYSSTVTVHERYLFELRSPGVSMNIKEVGLASQDAVRECYLKASKMELSRIDYDQYNIFLLESSQRSAVDLFIKVIPHTSSSIASQPSIITCHVGNVHFGCYVCDVLYLSGIFPSNIGMLYQEYIDDQYSELIMSHMARKRSWNVPVSYDVPTENTITDDDSSVVVVKEEVVTHSAFTDSTPPLETESSNDINSHTQSTRHEIIEEVNPLTLPMDASQSVDLPEQHVSKRKLFKNKLGANLELFQSPPIATSPMRSPNRRPPKDKIKAALTTKKASIAGVEVIINSGLNPFRLRSEPDDNRVVTDCMGVKRIVVHPCTASDQLEYLKLLHKKRQDESIKKQTRSLLQTDARVLFNIDITVQGVNFKIPAATADTASDSSSDGSTDVVKSVLSIKIKEIAIKGSQLDGRLHPSSVSIDFTDCDGDTVEDIPELIPNLPFEIYYDFQSVGRAGSKAGVQNSILSVGIKIFSSEIRISPATVSRLRSVAAGLQQSTQLQADLTSKKQHRKKDTASNNDEAGPLTTIQVSLVVEQFLAIVSNDRQQQLCMGSVQNTQISVQMTSTSNTVIEITQPVFKVVTEWSRIPLVVYHAESAGASPLFRYAYNKTSATLHNIYCDIRPVELYAPPSYIRDLMEVLTTPAFHSQTAYAEPVNATISSGIQRSTSAAAPGEVSKQSFKPLKPTSIELHMQCCGVTLLLDVPLADSDIANICSGLASQRGVFIKEYRIVSGQDLKIRMNTKGETSFDLALTKFEYSWQGKFNSQYFGDRKRMIGTGHLLLHAGRTLSSAGIYTAKVELTGDLLENTDDVMWTDVRLSTTDLVDTYKIFTQYLNVLSTRPAGSSSPQTIGTVASRSIQNQASFIRATPVPSGTINSSEVSEAALGMSLANLPPSTIKLKIEIPGVRIVLGDDSSKLDIDLLRIMVHTVQLGGVAMLPMSLSRLAHDASKMTVHCEGYVECDIQNYNVKTGLWDLITSCEPRISVLRLQDADSNEYDLKVSLNMFSKTNVPGTDTRINISEQSSYRSINRELQLQAGDPVTVTLNTKALLDTLFIFTNVKRRARATVANTAGAYTPASNNNCRHAEDTSVFAITNESGLDLEIANHDDNDFTVIKGKPYGNKFSLDNYVKRFTILIGVRQDDQHTPRRQAVGIRRVHRVYFEHSKLVVNTSVTGNVLSTLARSCVTIKNTLPYTIEIRFSPVPKISPAVISIPGGATRSVPCPLVKRNTFFDVKPILDTADSDSEDAEVKWSVPLKAFKSPTSGTCVNSTDLGNPGFPVYVYNMVSSNECEWKRKSEASKWQFALPAKCEMLTGEHGHHQVRNFFLSASYLPSWTIDDIPPSDVEQKLTHKDVIIAITPSVRFKNLLPVNIRYATRINEQNGSSTLCWKKIEPGATAILHDVPISGDSWLEISVMGDIEMRCQPFPIPKANTKKARSMQEQLRFASVSKSKKNIDKPTEGSCNILLTMNQDQMTARAELTLWAPIWFVNKIDSQWCKTVRVERKVRTILSWVSSSTCDIRDAPNYGMPFGVPVPYTPSNREPKEKISIVINDGQPCELVTSGELGSQTRICRDRHSQGVRFIPVSINATVVPSNFGKLSHMITLTDKYVAVNHTNHFLELRIAAPFSVKDENLSASSITPVLPCQSRVSFESPTVPTNIPYVTPIVWEYSSPTSTIISDTMPRLQVRLQTSERWSPAFSCSLLYGRVRLYNAMGQLEQAIAISTSEKKGVSYLEFLSLDASPSLIVKNLTDTSIKVYQKLNCCSSMESEHDGRNLRQLLRHSLGKLQCKKPSKCLQATKEMLQLRDSYQSDDEVKCEPHSTVNYWLDELDETQPVIITIGSKTIVSIAVMDMQRGVQYLKEERGRKYSIHVERGGGSVKVHISPFVHKETLRVRVVECNDLLAKDWRWCRPDVSDPFCTVTLDGREPNRGSQLTETIKNTISPRWSDSAEEWKIFHLTTDDQKDSILNLTVWDSDAFVDDFLGQTSIKISSLRRPRSGTKRFELQGRPGKSDWKGVHKADKPGFGIIVIQYEFISPGNNFGEISPEIIEEHERYPMTLHISLGLEISFCGEVSGTLREILFTQISPISLIVMKHADASYSGNLEVTRFQVDNCMGHADFHVIVGKQVPSKTDPAFRMCFANVRFRRLLLDINYISFYLSPLKVTLGDADVLSLYTIFATCWSALNDSAVTLSELNLLLTSKPMPPPIGSGFGGFLKKSPDKNWIRIQEMLLHKIKLELTWLGVLGGTDLMPLLQSWGISLFCVDEAQIHLPEWRDSNLLVRERDFVYMSARHYLPAILRASVVFVGAVTVGNPSKVLRSLYNGGRSLVQEISIGFRTFSIEGCGRGIGRGVMLFIANFIAALLSLIAALFALVSRLCGSIDGYLGDNKYQRMHRIRLRIRPPRGFKDGISTGGMHLKNSVIAAAMGVVTRPMHGYQESGFSGGMLGVVGGTVAIAMKPSQGLVDFCATFCTGLIAVIHGPPESGRLRPPRVVVSGILSPYNATVSQVYDLFCHLNIRSGTLSSDLDNEYYVAHTNSSEDSRIYLITTVRVLCMLKDKKRVAWSFPLSDIRNVSGNTSLTVQTAGGRCLNSKFLLRFQSMESLSEFVGVIKDRAPHAEIAPELLHTTPIHKREQSFRRRKATISFPHEIPKVEPHDLRIDQVIATTLANELRLEMEMLLINK